MSKHTIDRRPFFALTAAGGGAVFLSGLFGQAQAADGMAMPYDEFFFVQLSDSHWGFKGDANPNAQNTLKKAVAAVNDLPVQPDFVFFTGDLTHTAFREFFGPTFVIPSTTRDNFCGSGHEEMNGKFIVKPSEPPCVC